MQVMLRIVTLILLLTCSPFCYIAEGYAEENMNSILTEVRVSSVIDLETIEVDNGRVIKLYGVNADYYKHYITEFKQEYLLETETGVLAGISKPYFKGESLDHLVHRALLFYEKLLIGREVYLMEIPASQSYIVYLDREKQQSLNQLTVRSGFLVASKSDQEILDLLIEQEEARISKAGLWGITVYVHDEGGWSESNFIYFALGSLVINFIFCMIVYGYYIRSRTFLGMLAVYASFLVTLFFTVNIYVSNEKRLLFWVPPVIVVILAFIGVTEFILYTRSKSRRGLLYVASEIVLFVLVVVVGFSSLYQGYSNNARKQTEISYSPPDYEYADSINIERPHGDYIAIPDNVFGTRELGEIHDTKITNNDYHLSTANALYFSAVTFFTVGYGDFSPKGFLKTISIIQMFIGYLSQVVLFSLVVSKVTSSGTHDSNHHKNEKEDHVIGIPSRTSRKNRRKRSKKYLYAVFFLSNIIGNIYILVKLVSE